MQIKKLNRIVVAVVCVTIIMLTLNSCSKKISFNTSPVVPAARGNVKIKKDKNENYTIEISISDLAEVERLEGENKTYVVWMVSNNENPKNIGQINSSTKRFSKKLSASFHSVSSSKPSRVFITAERDGTIQYPGNTVVLTTETM
jgi:anti-sigma-K factor RskA